jgi:tetratricopeptide (TPR) repeat protein
MPRRAAVFFVFAIVAVAGIRPAAAAESDADRAKALLDTLENASSKDERLAAAAELAELSPRIVEPLGEFLKRTRTVTPDQTRVILGAIKASVPDQSGRFQSPGREKAAAIRADDEFDWLAALVDLPPQAGLGEVIADVAAIRALAASKRVDAAEVILATGFADATMVYRDECGRQLRKMAPYSLPALIAGAKARKAKALARYSSYQLERMDRQDPGKALDATEGDEDLQIAVLEVFGKTEHREAVGAVFSKINDDAPRVRAAARAAWIAYVTKPHPPEAPKKKLVMPGGVLSEKEMPLWFNSLQLAYFELANRIELLFGEELKERADLEAATRRVFAHYDAERAARDATVFAEGKAKADAGDLAGAIAVFDRLIAEDPLRAERAEMAPVYLRHAQELEQAGQWAEAAAAFSKAHGLAPEGEQATDALAGHYYALGKAQEADGKDGGAAFRKAIELRPDYAQAKEAAAAAAGPGKSKAWILYLAGAIGAGAVVLLALGLARRR